MVSIKFSPIVDGNEIHPINCVPNGTASWADLVVVYYFATLLPIRSNDHYTARTCVTLRRSCFGVGPRAKNVH